MQYTNIPLFGQFLQALGAIGVNTSRNKKGGLVDQAVQLFKNHDRLILHVPPSGKREKTPYWKSGFYYIALTAGVPVVPAWLDASTATFGFDAPIYLTGNVTEVRMSVHVYVHMADIYIYIYIHTHTS